MDNQFNTLVRSYHDNFLQYRLTGNSNYQNAYTSAKQGIETILSSLESEVNSQKNTMSDFYNENIEEKMRETQSKNKELQKGIVRERDQIEAAKLRGVPTQDLTSRYIALGVLGAIVLILSVV